MKTPKLVHVTCKDCTRPLFAIRIFKPGKVSFEGYGAKFTVRPARLGVDRVGVAVCPDCNTETEFDATDIPIFPLPGA